MSNRDYILKEKRLMEMDCRRIGIRPEEWISKFAQSYYAKHASTVLAPCFDGYK